MKILTKYPHNDDEPYLIVNKEVHCDHCGDLEPYDFVWFDGCTYWCEDCVSGMIPDDDTPSEEDLKKIKELSADKKLKYYKQKIKELGK